MKIMPLTNLNNFRGSSTSPRTFEKITSKTAEILYNTDFIYSAENFGQDCYATFVWSEETQKPLEVYIKPINICAEHEEFAMYSSCDCSPSTELGLRYYDLDFETKHIIPGFLRSLNKKVKGVGFRLQQLTFERMLMLNFENIELLSTVKAYPFHKCMGYTGSKESGFLSLPKKAKNDWLKIAQKQPIFLGKFKI